MTSSNGNIFRITGPLCGEFTGTREFPAQRPVTRSFDIFFDLRLNKRLSKQPRGWWFETPPWSLWRQCNDIFDQWISIQLLCCSASRGWWYYWLFESHAYNTLICFDINSKIIGPVHKCDLIFKCEESITFWAIVNNWFESKKFKFIWTMHITWY